jgi:hypothetical protein
MKKEMGTEKEEGEWGLLGVDFVLNPLSRITD